MIIYSSILSENQGQIYKKDIDGLFENFETAFSLYCSSQENLKFGARCLSFHIMAFFLCIF